MDVLVAGRGRRLVLELDIVGRRAVGALGVAGRALSLLMLLLHSLLGAVEATAVGTLCDRRHLGHGLVLLLSLLHFSIDLHLSSFDHTIQTM